MVIPMELVVVAVSVVLGLIGLLWNVLSGRVTKLEQSMAEAHVKQENHRIKLELDLRKQIYDIESDLKEQVNAVENSVAGIGGVYALRDDVRLALERVHARLDQLSKGK